MINIIVLILLLVLMSVTFVLSKISTDKDEKRHYEVLWAIFLIAIFIINYLDK